MFFFRGVTSIAEFRTLFIFALFLFVFFGLKGTFRYAFILGASAFSGVVIKIITQRSRPFVLFEFAVQMKATNYPGGYSFISGHMLAAVISALYLFFTVNRLLKNTKHIESKKVKTALKISVALVLAIITLLVGFSRIYLGVHYISDVLFALLLGFLFYYVYSFIYDKYIAETKILKFACLFGAVAFAVAGFIINFDKLTAPELVSYSALVISAAITYFIKEDGKINLKFFGKFIVFITAAIVFIVLELNKFEAVTPTFWACVLLFSSYLVYGVLIFILIEIIVNRRVENVKI